MGQIDVIQHSVSRADALFAYVARRLGPCGFQVVATNAVIHGRVTGGVVTSLRIATHVLASVHYGSGRIWSRCGRSAVRIANVGTDPDGLLFAYGDECVCRWDVHSMSDEQITAVASVWSNEIAIVAEDDAGNYVAVGARFVMPTTEVGA